MTRVHRVDDDALGNASYIVELGAGLAGVVDPRRDIEPYLDLADRLGLRVVVSFETHLHADFVTGSLELADATGAEVIASSEADLAFGHRGVAEGDTLTWSDHTVRVMATPGHTPEHVSYAVERDGEALGVFTGGSLIVGGAARTDLIAADRTEPLARQQFRSLRSLARLPDSAALWPTHGAGSFCSAGSGGGAATTIGAQRRTNPLMAIDDEDEFVRRLLDGFGTYPPYFLELRRVNRSGPRRLDSLDAPHPLEPADVAEHVAAGAWLVDARPVRAWAAAHPRGAVSNRLRPAFASWLGWVVPFDAPVVLVVEGDAILDAVTLARRIGYDHVLGWLRGGVEAWRRAGLPVETVETVGAEEAAARVNAGATLVDVRQAAEVDAGHVPGALHLELGDIVGGKTPEVDDVVTFCGHGERSATAAGILASRGVRVAILDGGLPAWERAGLPVSR